VRSSPLLEDDGTAREDLIVQAFVPSVETRGEFSLVMIGGLHPHRLPSR
jgi:hypothetical protein